MTLEKTTIQANELRLGNWFYGVTKCGIDSPVQIDNISHDSDMERIVPIPLTPEILEKVGFVQTSNFHPEGPVHTLKHRNGCTFEVAYGYHMVDIKQNIGRIRIQNIKYLHQLQNLFYSNVGEELTINL